MELRGDGGAFLSRRLPVTQQRQEKFRKGGSVVVWLRGRMEMVGTRKMEGWRGRGGGNPQKKE